MTGSGWATVAKGVLYISGPMTGYPNHNFDEFNYVEEALKQRGWTVLNPATKGLVLGWKWEDYLKYDLQQVLTSDGLAVLPGWMCSRGACLEVSTAQALGIPVMPWIEWRDQA